MLPIGDTGQRFEVRMVGYPKEGQNVLGWASTLSGAKAMMAAILQAPGCTGATIFDRARNREVITFKG